MTTNIIIQARMSSTRLPGKTMMPLANKESLWHVIERSKQSKANKIIIATSIDKSDDIIESKCNEWQVPCVRGNLNNVLSRYIDATNLYPSDNIVRITGDCPLIDPKIINLVIDSLKEFDYASNVINRDFPRGLDTEVFTQKSLIKAFELASEDRDKEHVTLFIRENKNKIFKTIDVPTPKEYQYPQFRLTLDTDDDYKLLTKIYKEFYKQNSIIKVPDVLTWLTNNKDIADINKHIEQKEA